MGNVADDAQTAAIIKSADLYLYKRGGEATMNTDFKEENLIWDECLDLLMAKKKMVRFFPI